LTIHYLSRRITIENYFERKKKPMKKLVSLLLALSLALALTACGQKDTAPDTTQTDDPQTEQAEPVEMIVFAAASMTETLTEIAELYKTAAPEVTITYNFDSSGKLLTQIKEGADCDLFISAAPKQMNALDGSLIGNTEKNPDGLDRIVTGSRIDLLENKVTLAVPEGNPKGIESFDQLAELLKGGDVMLAIGNSDVPVGQYTLKIFNYYGIDETAVADKLTYGNNVKEVTSQGERGCRRLRHHLRHRRLLRRSDGRGQRHRRDVRSGHLSRRRAQGGQGGRRARLPRLSPDRCRYDRIRVRRLQPRDLIGLQFVPSCAAAASGKRSTPNRSEERRPHTIPKR